MWQPLLNVNQLNQGSRLRQVVHEGNFQNETIYIVTMVGQLFFMVQVIEQNHNQLPEDQQIVLPLRTQGIPYYGYEIWTE